MLALEAHPTRNESYWLTILLNRPKSSYADPYFQREQLYFIVRIALREDGNAPLIVKSSPHLVVGMLVAEFRNNSIMLLPFELILMRFNFDLHI